MTAAIPYYPGYEPLWVGDNVARAQVDESELVHPIADGAEAYYTYETGDSIRFTLPDKRTIELRELKVRPREPKWNLAVGSLWFDTESGQLVRAAYRLADSDRHLASRYDRRPASRWTTCPCGSSR